MITKHEDHKCKKCQKELSSLIELFKQFNDKGRVQNGT